MSDPLTRSADKAIDAFEPQLLKVMKELDKKIIDLVGSFKTESDVFDAASILNSRGAMIQTLRDSGYNQLVEDYVKEYEAVPAIIKKEFAGRNLPPIKYSTADVETFKQIATADLEAFNVIGVKAMDDLRLGLYRQSLSSEPFSNMVDKIHKSTIGETKQARSSKTGELLRRKDGGLYKKSPLSNYAYTYANTSYQSFGGEVARVAGEAIGVEKWECVGPLDGKTRPECVAALADPIRTKEEWQDADYWTYSRYNCRHTLYPSIEVPE